MLCVHPGQVKKIACRLKKIGFCVCCCLWTLLSNNATLNGNGGAAHSCKKDLKLIVDRGETPHSQNDLKQNKMFCCHFMMFVWLICVGVSCVFQLVQNGKVEVDFSDSN